MIDLSCPTRNDFSVNLKPGWAMSATITVTRKTASIEIPGTGFSLTVEPDKSNVQEVVGIAKRSDAGAIPEVTNSSGAMAAFPRTAS